LYAQIREKTIHNPSCGMRKSEEILSKLKPGCPRQKFERIRPRFKTGCIVNVNTVPILWFILRETGIRGVKEEMCLLF
jgi:hypothetical protein